MKTSPKAVWTGALLLAAPLVAFLVPVLAGFIGRPVDRAWCERQMAAAGPLISALERYRDARGAYPADAGELVPGLLPALPRTEPDRDGNGGDGFRYARLSGGGFELAVPTQHWVSSFDALYYRSSGSYPTAWADGRTVIPMKCWVYVVGADGIWSPSTATGR